MEFVLNIILKVIYYFGLVSCGIQGIQKANKNRYSVPMCFLAAFLSSFAGGLIRDIWILHTNPVVFTFDCIPEIIIALGSAWIYSQNLYKKKHIKLFIILTDSAGISQFLVIGSNKALLFKENYAFAVLSGVCTSLGGGIASSIFTGESIRQTMLSNLRYRITDIAGAIIYAILLKNNVNQTVAQIVILVYTFFFISICNNLIFEVIKRVIAKKIYFAYKYNTYINWEYIFVIVKMQIYKRQFCCKLPKSTLLPACLPNLNIQRTILFHRIRQM